MKLSSILIFLMVVISCSLSRYSENNFTGKVFEWGASPMLGKSSIKFITDSSFIYSERDSLFISSGNWYLSPDMKTIRITGTDIPLNNNLNPPIKIKINKVFTIIGATKLRDDERKLFETTQESSDLKRKK